MSPVRIGARGSHLSRVQSGHVQLMIAAALGAGPDETEKVAPLTFITTTGDRIQDRRLIEAGGKALFTKEIEAALLDGEIDVAIHSLKDVPAVMPPGLVLAGFPQREDPRDALVSIKWRSLDAMPEGARIGTASLRRQAQLLARRPDLEIGMLRGNVDTRLGKLAVGEHDGIILAAAGLRRLGLAPRITEMFDPVAAPPSPGQGVLAIQMREADLGAAWLQAVSHGPTALAVEAERAAMAVLEGSCRTAIGAYASIADDHLALVVEGLTADGRMRWRREGRIPLGENEHARARALGAELGEQVRDEAGDRLRVV